ncbi:putative ribonuclease H-like domain-containing protein [Tanacetum coccineum]|uniref:Ribonuclease H-like domain-containing protein n=1 Tax=Tanacetum coccineum TaxID=301880 RepID=A0ABQ4X4R1_9ASTR
MRPFGCHVTILNTLNPLGKFDKKVDEGFFVGYSINSKAFRAFNTRTRKVEENLHINFLENKSNVAGSGPDWLFNIDLLTNSKNYEPVTTGNQTNKNACIKDNVDAVPTQQYILLPLLYDSPQSLKDAVANDAENDQNVEDFRAELDNLLVQQKEGYANSINRDSTVSLSVSTAGKSFTNADDLLTDSLIPNLEDTGIFSGAYDDEDVGAKADLNNLETTMNVSPIPTTRIHKDHPKDHIIGDINSATQTRRMTKISEEHTMVSYIKRQRRTNHKDYQNCLFACFLSQNETKKTLVELPKGKRAIGTKWVYRNKKDERKIVVRNKVRLVAQGYTQEEGIDYDEVFALSAFLYGTIEEEVYVCQPPGFEYPQFPGKVYKVEKALYGLHQAPRAWYETLSTYLLESGFRRGTINKTLFIKKDKDDAQEVLNEFYRELTFFLGLQVTQKDDGIFISQDKYVADILKKFDFITIKTASTPIATNKALLNDEEAKDVDRIFRYLKGQPKLGLWYPRDSPFDLEAFSDSDYTGVSLDRKSTTGAEYVAAANCYGQVLWIQNQMLDYGFNFMNTKIHIDNESTWEDRMERAVTTASSLEAEQVSGNINRTQSMETLNESFPQGTDSGSGTRCQDTILEGAKAQIRFEAASK